LTVHVALALWSA